MQIQINETNITNLIKDYFYSKIALVVESNELYTNIFLYNKIDIYNLNLNKYKIYTGKETLENSIYNTDLIIQFQTGLEPPAFQISNVKFKLIAYNKPITTSLYYDFPFTIFLEMNEFLNKIKNWSVISSKLLINRYINTDIQIKDISYVLDEFEILDLFKNTNQVYIKFKYKNSLNYSINKPIDFYKILAKIPKLRIHSTDVDHVYLLKYLTNSKRIPKNIIKHKHTVASLRNDLLYLLYHLQYIVLNNNIIYSKTNKNTRLSIQYLPGRVTSLNSMLSIYIDEINYLRKCCTNKPKKIRSTIYNLLRLKKEIYSAIKYLTFTPNIIVKKDELEFFKIITEIGKKKWKKPN